MIRKSKSTKSKPAQDVGYMVADILSTNFQFKAVSSDELNDLTTGEQDKLKIDNRLAINVLNEGKNVLVDVQSKVRLAKADPDSDDFLILHVGRTNFGFTGLERFYDEATNKVDIPIDILRSIFSLAYNHSRALLTVELQKTIYSHKFTLPLIDVNVFLKGQKKE